MRKQRILSKDRGSLRSMDFKSGIFKNMAYRIGQ